MKLEYGALPKLEKVDWENVKQTATEQLRAAIISQEVNQRILDLATFKLSKFPKEKKKCLQK